MQEASIKQILSVMVDEDGNRFTGKKQIDLFRLNLYDPPSYRSRFEAWRESLGTETEMNIYGCCHDCDFVESERPFDTGHSAVCTEDDDYRRNLDRLLSANRLEGFDIIDMTLTLKDLRNPDAARDLMSLCVNDSRSTLFIRELDDKAVFDYPDEKGFVPKMLGLLRMDVNAGRRDMCARLRTMLSRIDASDDFISDQTISTPTIKPNFASDSATPTSPICCPNTGRSPRRIRAPDASPMLSNDRRATTPASATSSDRANFTSVRDSWRGIA